jgi:RNA polymerase sigma factor (sigma-70 family)
MHYVEKSIAPSSNLERGGYSMKEKNNSSKIKCYDTLKKTYVMVDVSSEVETFIRRSYWKEDMQERRYQSRKLPLEDNEWMQDYSESMKPLDQLIILRQETDALIQEVQELDQKLQEIIYLYYYEHLSMREVAEKLDYSVSKINDLLSDAREYLREQLVQKMKY